MPLYKWHFLFMKKITYLLALSLILLSNALYSQDLIVNTNNDSINCKVIKQNTETVFYFTYVNKEEVTNAIKKSDVKSLVLNYYSKGVTDSVKKKTNTPTRAGTSTINRKPRRQIDIIKGFRLSASYGAGYWVFINPSGMNSTMVDYFNELKTGNNFSLGFNYYGSSNFGVGFQFMDFSTKNTLSNATVIFTNGTSKVGTIEDDISMNYAGVSFGYRIPLANNKWRMAADIGIGLSRYRNDAIFITNKTITSSNLGLNTQIGFDYILSKNLALGVTGTLIRSSANTFEVFDSSGTQTITLPDGERESHVRADISFGLRFLIE